MQKSQPSNQATNFLVAVAVKKGNAQCQVELPPPLSKKPLVILMRKLKVN